MITLSQPKKKQSRTLIIVLALIVLAAILYWAIGKSRQSATTEKDLDTILADAGISALDFGDPPDPDKVALGEALFFDKEVSGNRDISCSTCHHPLAHTADDLPLSLGTGGDGLGINRIRGEERGFIPRHAPEIFNRGAEGWQTMFWDARVSGSPESGFHSPAADALPDGLDSVLAAQAMFPPTSGDEMRGKPGDVDIYGNPNELAMLADDDFAGIWGGIMDRLLVIPEYQALFVAAYPDLGSAELGFQHAANAIAAFEQSAFTFTDSPWDRYLAGEKGALSEDAKAGAKLFYGEARCSNCHAGNLFTDQEFHNIAVPQFGPGKNEEGFDFGRFNETQNENNYFQFRTPPLRNVAITGPWMHNGAYNTLEAAVHHHFDPAYALSKYVPALYLPDDLQATCKVDEESTSQVLEHLDPLLQEPIILTDQEVSQLVTFLESLTAPSAIDQKLIVPNSVPSGLALID